MIRKFEDNLRQILKENDWENEMALLLDDRCLKNLDRFKIRKVLILKIALTYLSTLRIFNCQ